MDTVRLLFQINRKMVNTIGFRFDSIRFRKDFSVCSVSRYYERPKLMRAPPETPVHHSAMVSRGLRGAPN